MELVLERDYLPDSTHGTLSIGRQKICQTLEAPWRNNKRSISCIPQGKYLIEKRVHPKHGLQLALSIVPNREPIIIHPSHFSLNELQGCIAPVEKDSESNKVEYNELAYQQLLNLVLPVLETDEKVYLIIKLSDHVWPAN